jgi:hypothetical protein
MIVLQRATAELIALRRPLSAMATENYGTSHINMIEELPQVVPFFFPITHETLVLNARFMRGDGGWKLWHQPDRHN